MALHPSSHKLPKIRTLKERTTGKLSKKKFVEILKKRAKA